MEDSYVRNAAGFPGGRFAGASESLKNELSGITVIHS